MGTHYDTLGVKQGSSTQEIRKAYLRRARALHPDRQQGRSETDARRAEKAMQQVNVAWNVLSDTKKKSEYDQSLKPRRAASQATRPATQQRTAQQRPQPRQPTPQQARPAAERPQNRPIDEDPGDGSISVWASMPVLLVLGLLLGILIVTAFAGDKTDDAPSTPGQQSAQLDVGDCFALIGNTPRERSCASGASDGQVVEIGPEPGNCPGNTQSLLDPNTNFFLCWARMVPGSSNTIPAN